MFLISVLYLDFEGAKNTHVLQVLIWGFGGCWRFLTGGWHLEIDLDKVIGLLIPMIQIVAFYLYFEDTKKVHVL